MTRLLTILTITMLGLGLAVSDADARRLAGGSSVGKQRSTITQPRSTPQPSQAAPAPSPTPQPAGGRSWLGPLAGLAAGGLLGALLFGHAFDGLRAMDILMVLLLAGAIFFVWRMLRRPHDTATREPMRYAGADPLMRTEPVMRTEPTLAAVPPPAQLPGFPAGFDADAFVRHAKVNFIKLQAANDAKDMAMLRDFMTAELFREISGEIEQRGSTPQHTDVVTLNAEVIDVATEAGTYIASVRFSGLIREEANVEAQTFSEVWHLEKPVEGKAGWLIAGIQQD